MVSENFLPQHLNTRNVNPTQTEATGKDRDSGRGKDRDVSRGKDRKMGRGKNKDKGKGKNAPGTGAGA